METVEKKEKVGISGYAWFLLALLFFSGAFRGAPAPLNLLDLSTYLGSFGTIVEGAAPGILGKGGSGLNNLFLTCFTIAPGVMFSVAFMEAVEYYGGLKAAGKLLTPLLRPLMGVPGESALVMICNLQSSDTSAAMIKSLYDSKTINAVQQGILLAFCLPGPALLGMMISYGVMLYPYLLYGSGIVIVTVLLSKFIVANLMRIILMGGGKNNKKPAAQEV